MKQKYTEFIVRVYHHTSERTVGDYLMGHLSPLVKDYFKQRKITVKKYKRLSEEKIAVVINKYMVSNKCCIGQEYLEELAKTICEAQK